MFETIWYYVDIVSTFGGFVAACSATVFSVWNWRKTTNWIKSNREAKEAAQALITIMLRSRKVVEGEERETLAIPYKPRRNQLSRSELLGLLGMYYGESRFESRELCEILENGSFNDVIADGSTNTTLFIDLESSIFDKFKPAVLGRR